MKRRGRAAASKRALLPTVDGSDALPANEDSPLAPPVQRTADGASQRDEISRGRAALERYLRSTRLHAVLEASLAKLFSCEELPENPFVFLSELSGVEEHAQALFHGPVREETPVGAVDPPAAGGVTCCTGSASFWGLKHVLQLVDVDALEAMRGRMLGAGHLLVQASVGAVLGAWRCVGAVAWRCVGVALLPVATVFPRSSKRR